MFTLTCVMSTFVLSPGGAHVCVLDLCCLESSEAWDKRRGNSWLLSHLPTRISVMCQVMEMGRFLGREIKSPLPTQLTLASRAREEELFLAS